MKFENIVPRFIVSLGIIWEIGNNNIKLERELFFTNYFQTPITIVSPVIKIR